ncbi:diguanylate cyclase [Aliarcobacter skirrowii]|uniref:diguanylate cyclase n=1 Tax=Aliarcobacter skirrowii TaxID=28200 RepID=UPI0029BE6D52|nr:diguanylate cyclase [Aliarcobacter skirrowii]MDX4064610.1 diguanylate cyclase [Aliarcobacter skirrowii]
MKYLPKLIDIATKAVTTVDDTQSINDAISLMYKENHREIIILSNTKKGFGIIKANDLIRLKSDNIDFNTKLKDIKYDKIFSTHYKTSIPDAIEEIGFNGNSLCLVDDDDKLCGFVSYHDIISSVDPQLMLEKQTLSDMLLSSFVKKADINDLTKDVIELMDDTIYDCVIIFDKSNSVGILTTKDIIKLFGESKDLNLPVSNYMRSPLVKVKHTTTVSQALEFIQQQKFKRLIIEDFAGNVIGQITQKELLARVYSKWADFLRDKTVHLSSINSKLQSKTTQLEQLASTDNLTSLYNRAKFEQKLKHEISRATRYENQEFSIILFDVDNFKIINDTYGHLAGDMVLKKIADLVKNTIRSTDFACRWGGEEFFIIYPSTNLKQAFEASEKLRILINKLEFDDIKNISCSFGVTKFNKSDSMQSILARADKAMYKAKNNGRNRVEIEE